MVDGTIIARSYSSSGSTSTGVFGMIPKGSTLSVTGGSTISLIVKEFIIGNLNFAKYNL